VTLDPPALSVIVVTGRRRFRSSRAIQSVLRQKNQPALEVLVLDCVPDTVPPLPESDHASVRYFRQVPGTSFNRIRAKGVRLARSPIVAFLEEHCVVDAGWASAIVHRHRESWAGVGGEVRPIPGAGGLNAMTTLISYAPWISPVEKGETTMIPGHNSSYKRDPLLQFGDELTDLLRNDFVLQSRLRQSGHRLFLDPEIGFFHYDMDDIHSIMSLLHLYSRWHADMRAKAMRWSFLRRFFYIALSPLIPWVRMIRNLRSAWNHSGRQFLDFLKASPFGLICHSCSVFGQTQGLIVGSGSAEKGFTSLELHTRRFGDEAPLRP
jgi:hypothetical protein